MPKSKNKREITAITTTEAAAAVATQPKKEINDFMYDKQFIILMRCIVAMPCTSVARQRLNMYTYTHITSFIDETISISKMLWFRVVDEMHK